MAEPLLSVSAVSVSFDTPRGAVHALDDVSLDLWPRQTIGVVGESGSGKSVLARTIMNLLPRNASVGGSVRFLGRDVRDLPPDERKHFWGTRIGMVFQDPMTSLNPTKRIGTQLTEGLRYHKKLSRSEARTAALELLDQVHIPDAARRLRQYPHELSGGMRQRIVIAIALACEPRLLIADEPTTALDVTVQRRILDLLDELRRDREMGLILITHDLGVVKGRADEIMVMYGGRVMERADTASLFAGHHHPYTEALLGSIPRLDKPAHTRLVAIPGRPPNLVDLPRGCRFTARCGYAQERCASEEPSLFRANPEHEYACFHPLPHQSADAQLATGT
ncbi:ABC transporter ATP-binding protein [Dactylosporangium sp. AC04546]|uniref:ABC transporter ATP-binding protein n=1 Tax=Dactylosporangium sp. AC04546 TaxID=2862460 RepID=UPI001EDDFF12|nr:ABC transporter ATP-binding protein [Dactylosporangium sp. AC04546]WVK86939.1 ABC transporter ATP-binding protein [Dactylosporangium sp. AC04546]